MRQITRAVLLTSFAVVAMLAARSAADEPKPAGAKPANQLIGTWKLVSAKYGGKEVKFPEGITRIKHVTPTQFMWASCDKDGEVAVALGGTYTLDGNKYEELPEYGTGEILKALKGKPQTFTWKVEGDKWYHTGKLSTDLTIEEVWERVAPK